MREKTKEAGIRLTGITAKYRLRKLIRPVVMQMTKTRVRYRLVLETNRPAISTTPVIYAVNHTNSADIPMACRAIGRHSLVLVGRQRLYLSDRLFFFLNGAIWVDRKDKADMMRAKEEILHLLYWGMSVIWFPEGTWNMTDHLLMLPMKWGIVDVAQQAQCRVIPLAMEYDRENNTCRAMFGQGLSFSGLSKQKGIQLLRDSMASLRWASWESKGLYTRDKLNIQNTRRQIMRSVNEYPPLDLHYEQSVVFDPYKCINPKSESQDH